MEELRRVADLLSGIEDPVALLAGFFAHAPVGFAILHKDGTLLLANRAFNSMFGGPIPGYSVHEDKSVDEQGLREHVRRAFAGETVQVPARWFTVRQLQPERRIAVEITLFPLRNKKGAVTHVATCITDVTAQMLLQEGQEDRQRHEAALRRSEEMRLLALEASESVAWSINFATDTLTILGGDGSRGVEIDMPQAMMLEMIHPDDRPIVVEALRRAAEGSSPPKYVCRVFRPDRGEFRWMEARGVPLRGPEGKINGATGLSIDITERVRADELQARAADLELQNRRIQEANRLKSEFLANMSHELRTPLNAIIGFTELLHDGEVPSTAPEHKEFLGDILTSSRHLLQLINDVLDLAKVEAGKLDFYAEPVNLSDAVVEVCSILRTIAASKRVHVEIDIAPAVHDVSLDPARLKQILYNYLSNALKFTPPGGRVIIRARPEEEGMFRLEVEDSGPGIAHEDIGRLFVEFAQLHRDASKKHGGTGLGLALVRRLTEAQGGSVGVESTPGRGSVFYAILPRRAPKLPSRPAPQQFGDGVNQRVVLVIEDDIDQQASIVDALTDAGYAVDAVATGADALARCRERAFDAITLDLLLPDMSGLEALAAVRATGLNQTAPIVVVTAVSEAPSLSGVAVHATLCKPFRLAELFAALESAGVTPGPKTGT